MVDLPVRFRSYKVRTLPGVTQPNAVYYVMGEGANGVSQYVTDKDGNAFPLVAEATIGNLDLGTF